VNEGSKANKAIEKDPKFALRAMDCGRRPHKNRAMACCQASLTAFRTRIVGDLKNDNAKDK
jgi:hypothetical protein